MPVDLDELFDALGRQADALPLGGADRARQRGRRRSRVRAAVAAVAVALVTMGVGVTLHHPARQTTPPAERPMPELASPIFLGGQAVTSLVATDGIRAYAAFVCSDDNSVRLTAADLRTGEPAWAGEPIVVDPQRGLLAVVAVPSAVLVITVADGATPPLLGLFAFNPVTGKQMWNAESGRGDSLVFTTDMFVRLTRSTGRVEGLDWRSGQTRWTRTSGERAVRAVGMGMPADEAKLNRAGPPLTVSDRRVVLLTDRGWAEVHDAVTGQMQQSVPVSPTFGDTVVAYDGWLYTHDEADDSPGPQRIRVTDLTGDRGTAVVAELNGRFITLGACGAGLVCAATRNQEGPPASLTTNTITAIDPRRRQMAWQADTSMTIQQISSGRGATLFSGTSGLELRDVTGAQVYRSIFPGGWLDPRSLLVVMADGTERLARLTVADGKVVPYALTATDLQGCASTSIRLACVSGSNLWVWEVT